MSKLPVNQVVCGDCIEVMSTFPDESIDIIVTDPPFNISKQGADITRDYFRNPNLKHARTIHYDFGDWDRRSNSEYFNLMKQWIEIAIVKLRRNCNFVSFIAKENISLLHYFMLSKGFHFRNTMAWIKTNPVPHLRKVNFASGLEFIYWGSRGKNTFNWKLGHSTNYFKHSIVMGKERLAHPTQKPEALIEWLLQYLSKENDVVLDPFVGSGTTCVVAEKLGRRWIGIDLKPEYVEMAKQRLMKECSHKLLDYT